MNQIKKGSTDVTRYVMLRDSTAGTPETGYTITNLDLQYTRNRTAPATKVDATALAATNSAHGDNQAIEVDATSSPGLYRVDWPDAAFATGADKVLLVVSGSGIDPAVEEIQLVDFDPQDGVRLGLTALPNAAADAAGGLPISDAGGLDLDAQRSDVAAILVDTGTTLQGELDGIQADTEDIQTRIGTPANLGGGADMASNLVDISNNVQADTQDIQSRLPAALVSGRMDSNIQATAASLTFNLTGNITGNLSGSVGSVTGAVGSVTANVNAVLADTAHGGTSATLRLGGSTSTPALYITNSGGDAVQLEATGSNGKGLDVLGHGTGHAVHLTAGSSGGDGVHSESSAGDGMHLAGSSGPGLHITAGTNVQPLLIQGSGTAPAVYLAGGSSAGTALYLVGGTGGKGLDVVGDIAVSGATTFTGAITATNASNNLRLGTFTVTTNAIAWNAAWDAEVQSEAEDALIAHNLDHLVKSAVDTDFATTVHVDSVVGQLAQTADGGFSRATDSLEAVRDNMGTAQTGDAFARLGAPAGASVSADIAAVKSDTAAILLDTGTDGVAVSAASVRTAVGLASANLDTQLDALPTAAENAAALLDLSNGIETSVTPRQALRLMLAALAGKLSGAATTTITIRNVGDSKDRITATVDSSGNRTAVTTDGT